MFEFYKDIVLVFGRIITIIPLLLLVTLYMGKRAIGELPVFDFLIILTLGAVAGADIADPTIKQFPTAVAIILMGLFQKVVSKLEISNRKLGRLLTFEPTVVIHNGKFLHKNMKKIRYSIDKVLQMLREKDVFQINDVETAIIEANGSISVLKKVEKNPVTLEDMQIVKTISEIAFPVIIEGKVYNDVLKSFQLNEVWLQQQLSLQGVHDLKSVFFASINRRLELHVSLKEENHLDLPPLKH